MRLAVHLARRLRVRRVAEAKNLSGFFVDPIPVVTDAVFFLHFDVMGMGFGNVLRGNATRDFVNVHVRRHTTFRLAVKRREIYFETQCEMSIFGGWLSV